METNLVEEFPRQRKNRLLRELDKEKISVTTTAKNNNKLKAMTMDVQGHTSDAIVFTGKLMISTSYTTKPRETDRGRINTLYKEVCLIQSLVRLAGQHWELLRTISL